MPSDKKRINLTVPDAIYERLQAYKEKNGLTNDATVCLQLIVRQLNADEHSETIFKLIQGMSVDQLAALSKEGYIELQKELGKQVKPSLSGNKA